MSTERPYHLTHLFKVSKKSLWSLTYTIFSWFNTCIYPRGRGHTALRGKSLDVNRNFLSLRSQKHKGSNLTLPIIGQCKPRVTIWTNFVIFKHLMLHTKIQGYRPFGSGEKRFLRCLLYMGMAAILVMWPGPFKQIFVETSYEIWLQLTQWFL